MIDFNAYRDSNDDNKTPNRLSELFVFGSGYPRFSYALSSRFRKSSNVVQPQMPLHLTSASFQDSTKHI